jgi:TRAP-type C4-dicarboxylate transport system permease small subunit
MANKKSINPVAVCVILFAGGMALAAWGWNKNESTIASHTHGAVAMIVIGCVMIIAGAIGFFTVGNKS